LAIEAGGDAGTISCPVVGSFSAGLVTGNLSAPSNSTP